MQFTTTVATLLYLLSLAGLPTFRAPPSHCDPLCRATTQNNDAEPLQRPSKGEPGACFLEPGFGSLLTPVGGQGALGTSPTDLLCFAARASNAAVAARSASAAARAAGDRQHASVPPAGSVAGLAVAAAAAAACMTRSSPAPASPIAGAVRARPSSALGAATGAVACGGGAAAATPAMAGAGSSELLLPQVGVGGSSIADALGTGRSCSLAEEARASISARSSA